MRFSSLRYLRVSATLRWPESRRQLHRRVAGTRR